MRVIAGQLGSRIFEAPKGHKTHPMSERARGGLFNSLGNLEGKRVLDAFAGSGALSIEAISRGAESAVAIEKDHQAMRVLESNLTKLGIDETVKAIRANVSSWSDLNDLEQFDLIICDPPYDNLQLSTIKKLVKHLKINGLMIISYPGRESAPTVNGVVVVDRSYYGDAALAYYRTSED